ncbi:hypothetical protein SUDANB106_03543 [Streptomyces sp. enrichment culture]
MPAHGGIRPIPDGMTAGIRGMRMPYPPRVRYVPPQPPAAPPSGGRLPPEVGPSDSLTPGLLT